LRGGPAGANNCSCRRSVADDIFASEMCLQFAVRRSRDLLAAFAQEFP
jgi:hypothetical protein